jgi:hypothetical protein
LIVLGPSVRFLTSTPRIIVVGDLLAGDLAAA